ncbi:integrase core domain-containing protein [Streptomyces sp. WP-1]|uniref:integrase core domain-containing protein n=1 Tax=Streptomyces sp. WP-1 TaxID=3041497 RepID=UPI002648E585|nr:integrase core domain-containing protein [Streptomyces sp. WP-1]WKE68167.1 integrase core domain-containing protein [Streptomyces sp. WP-1]
MESSVHSSSRSPPGEWSAGSWPTICAPSWSSRCCGPSAADAAPPGRRFSIQTAAVGTTSREFSLLADEFNIRLSISRTGQCWDDALAESFFATPKGGLFGDRSWPSGSVARTVVFEWTEGWYKLHRLHSSLGYRGPADHEAALAA